MNQLKLLEYTLERVVYQYIPENKGEPGEIVFYIPTKKATVQKRAANDEFGRYGYNATRRVAEYVENNNLPISAVQAWY
jgi:hypothetical protein